ncbi:MAG: hypothetical protein KatS3mg102_0277 [Planctomycetota bacterium]|nr:MAG: hypothetical protein KatS3mg102_0277 [Planctomycetota bacterium]
MALELLYTSAPRGLRPGSSGFCTVRRSRGLSTWLQDRLEACSGYHPPPGLPLEAWPPAFFHLQLRVGDRLLSVLSRVGPAGPDHTGRPNQLAHHLVVEPHERPLAGPAWVLRQPGLMRAFWDGELGETEPVRLPQTDRRPSRCVAWERACGDAGWAGALVDRFVHGGSRRLWVIYEPGLDVLELIEEALALLPPDRRWEVGFHTLCEQSPPFGECHWRFCPRGGRGSRRARASGDEVWVLAELGRCERRGPLVALARGELQPAPGPIATRPPRPGPAAPGRRRPGLLVPAAAAGTYAPAPSTASAGERVRPAPCPHEPLSRRGGARRALAALLALLLAALGALAWWRLRSEAPPAAPVAAGSPTPSQPAAQSAFSGPGQHAQPAVQGLLSSTDGGGPGAALGQDAPRAPGPPPAEHAAALQSEPSPSHPDSSGAADQSPAGGSHMAANSTSTAQLAHGIQTPANQQPSPSAGQGTAEARDTAQAGSAREREQHPLETGSPPAEPPARHRIVIEKPRNDLDQRFDEIASSTWFALSGAVDELELNVQPLWKDKESTADTPELPFQVTKTADTPGSPGAVSTTACWEIQQQEHSTDDVGKPRPKPRPGGPWRVRLERASSPPRMPDEASPLPPHLVWKENGKPAEPWNRLVIWIDGAGSSRIAVCPQPPRELPPAELGLAARPASVSRSAELRRQLAPGWRLQLRAEPAPHRQDEAGRELAWQSEDDQTLLQLQMIQVKGSGDRDPGKVRLVATCPTAREPLERCRAFSTRLAEARLPAPGRSEAPSFPRLLIMRCDELSASGKTADLSRALEIARLLRDLTDFEKTGFVPQGGAAEEKCSPPRWHEDDPHKREQRRKLWDSLLAQLRGPGGERPGGGKPEVAAARPEDQGVLQTLAACHEFFHDKRGEPAAWDPEADRQRLQQLLEELKPLSRVTVWVVAAAEGEESTVPLLSWELNLDLDGNAPCKQ